MPTCTTLHLILHLSPGGKSGGIDASSMIDAIKAVEPLEDRVWPEMEIGLDLQFAEARRLLRSATAVFERQADRRSASAQ